MIFESCPESSVPYSVSWKVVFRSFNIVYWFILHFLRSLCLFDSFLWCKGPVSIPKIKLAGTGSYLFDIGSGSPSWLGGSTWGSRCICDASSCHPLHNCWRQDESMPLDQLISSMSASSSPCGVSIELPKYSTLPFTTNTAATTLTDRVENDILWVLNRPWRKTCQRRVTGLFHLVSHS